MSLPRQFGLRGRVTPTRAAPVPMSIAQTGLRSTLGTVSGADLCLDGSEDTFAHLSGSGANLIVDLGDWYKMKSYLMYYQGEGQGIPGDVLQLEILRHPTNVSLGSGANTIIYENGNVDNNFRCEIIEPSGTDQKFVRYVRIKKRGHNNVKVYIMNPSAD